MIPIRALCQWDWQPGELDLCTRGFCQVSLCFSSTNAFIPFHWRSNWTFKMQAIGYWPLPLLYARLCVVRCQCQEHFSVHNRLWGGFWYTFVVDFFHLYSSSPLYPGWGCNWFPRMIHQSNTGHSTYMSNFYSQSVVILKSQSINCPVSGWWEETRDPAKSLYRHERTG